jgi:hypothetical protein
MLFPGFDAFGMPVFSARSFGGLMGLSRRELRPVSQHRAHDDRKAASQSDSR